MGRDTPTSSPPRSRVSYLADLSAWNPTGVRNSDPGPGFVSCLATLPLLAKPACMPQQIVGKRREMILNKNENKIARDTENCEAEKR